MTENDMLEVIVTFTLVETGDLCHHFMSIEYRLTVIQFI